MTTSRPVWSPPSTAKVTRPRNPFMTRTCCVSARPSSQGLPAYLTDDSGEAPVPPSAPLIWITSAYALATPAAIVPTPSDATNFTATFAVALAVLRS